MTGSKRVLDEAMLSGYLDGALTQADEQRVRLYLEDSAEARSVLEEMRSVRALTLGSDFAGVPDDQWDERPRGAVSRGAFRLGWILVAGWVALFAILALWSFATSPEGWGEKLAFLTLIGGGGLLFLSVLLDRVKARKTDRYRGVHK